MSNIIEVPMGQLAIGVAPTILTTSSIGSCVAVCLYSHLDKKGALAHIMLPQRPDTGTPLSETDYRFADVAIEVMVQSLEHEGIPRNHLVAKMAGGANMFPGVEGRSHRVGDRNVEAVKICLENHRITLAADNTGGNNGRSLTFDLGNGIVTIQITI